MFEPSAIYGRLPGTRLKGIGKAHMKRLVITMIIKMFAESILIVTIIGAVIGILGYINKWDSSITYSNAFFLAGCLIIIAGASSRLSAGRDWENFQLLNAESFRNMSSGERAEYIINASSSLRLVILGSLSGILLMLISAIAAKIS